MSSRGRPKKLHDCLPALDEYEPTRAAEALQTMLNHISAGSRLGNSTTSHSTTTRNSRSNNNHDAFREAERRQPRGQRIRVVEARSMMVGRIDVASTQPGHARASELALQRLPKTRLLPSDKEENEHDTRVCVVCCHRLVEGIALTRLPCGHVYHIICIVPWLERKNSCPECRYEIESKGDESYEADRQVRMATRMTVSCTCHPSKNHSCFFDETKLIVKPGTK